MSGGRGRTLARGLMQAVMLWLVCEVLTAALILWKVPGLERIRLSLLGLDRSAPVMHRMVGQPYLSFIPAPGFRNYYGVQHNQQGYRGDPVPMRRVPGVARVLCLGGSTMYGWTVERTSETLPAQIQAGLAAHLPPGVKGVEVINGGIPTGTTAESLTHYQFKFHYYRPDVVVIEAGGNDGMVMDKSGYQPDYSPWRRVLPSVDPLPPQSRWMLHSRILSVGIIFLFRSEYVGMASYIQPPEYVAPTHWYPTWDKPKEANWQIPPEDLAYRHHLEVLVDLVRADGAKPILAPFRFCRTWPRDYETSCVERLEPITKAVADERHVPYIAEPDRGVDQTAYGDACHLNAAGEHQKAANYVPAVRRALGWPVAPDTP